MVVFWRGVWRRSAASHFREAALIIGLFLVYTAVSSLPRDGLEHLARENAEKLIAFESAVGFFREAGWNRWVVGMGGWFAAVFNWLYVLTFMAVIPIVALAYYVLDRDRYFHYRGVVVLSFFFALAAQAIFPVAPPRMMAEFGFVDTMKSFGPVWYDNRDAVAYFNTYAAMPSLHFAWSVIFGWIFFTQGSRLLKVVGVAYPLITFAAIIATANHYFLDAAAGAATMVLAYWVYEAVRIGGVLPKQRLFPLRKRVGLTAFTGRSEAVKSRG